MQIKSLKTRRFVKETRNEKADIAFLLGESAFGDAAKISVNDGPDTSSLIDDVDIVFEYLYLGHPNPHPDDKDLVITCSESDRTQFICGWQAEEKIFEKDMTEDSKLPGYDMNLFGPDVNFDLKEKVPGEPGSYYLSSAVTGRGKSYLYGSKYTYVEPRIIYDRFDKIDKSEKKIVFPKEVSELLWDIFQTANGKEIMFYGEITNPNDPNEYRVSSMNFPPQKNYGGYVETVDGKYESWVFNEVILKQKKIPLHVHTHPDFSAFSSAIDERQIKQYIEDNEGNPFVIQLIISNPRKGRYFIRWFDLENNTWETPDVEFTYDTYDVEANYPGIFQFNAPREYDAGVLDAKKFGKSFGKTSGYGSSRSMGASYQSGSYTPIHDDPTSERYSRSFWEDDDEDKEELDITDPKDFDIMYSKKYGFGK